MSVVVTMPMTRSSSSTTGSACTPDSMIRLATSSKTRGRPATRDRRPHDLLDAETRIEEGRAIGGAAGRKVLHLHQVGGTQHPDQALVADDGQVMDRVVQEAVERFADGTVDFDHDHGLGHDPRYRLFGSHGPRVLRAEDSADSGCRLCDARRIFEGMALPTTLSALGISA